MPRYDDAEAPLVNNAGSTGTPLEPLERELRRGRVPIGIALLLIGVVALNSMGANDSAAPATAAAAAPGKVLVEFYSEAL